MEEGEEGAEGAAEEDDVVAVVDGSCEGVFVGVQAGDDAAEGCWGGGGGGGGFEVAVEFEELGEEGEDECEGDLWEEGGVVSFGGLLSCGWETGEGEGGHGERRWKAQAYHTRSRSNEMKRTLRIFLRS